MTGSGARACGPAVMSEMSVGQARSSSARTRRRGGRHAIRVESANVRASPEARSGQWWWSTRQMVERSRVGDDPLPKRVDRTRRERNAIGQRGMRRRQCAGHMVSHAERAVCARLPAVLVRISSRGLSVVAADAERLSRCDGRRDARDEDAGEDDVEDEGIDRNECSPPSDPSLANEPRHSTQFPAGRRSIGRGRVKVVSPGSAE